MSDEQTRSLFPPGFTSVTPSGFGHQVTYPCGHSAWYAFLPPADICARCLIAAVLASRDARKKKGGAA